MNLPATVDRAKIAHAFKECLDYLSTGRKGDEQTNYICYALGKAAAYGTACNSGAYWAKFVVEVRIGLYGNARLWLMGNVPEARDATHYQIQQWRRAWVRSMIEEFSK